MAQVQWYSWEESWTTSDTSKSQPHIACIKPMRSLFYISFLSFLFFFNFIFIWLLARSLSLHSQPFSSKFLPIQLHQQLKERLQNLLWPEVSHCRGYNMPSSRNCPENNRCGDFFRFAIFWNIVNNFKRSKSVLEWFETPLKP